MTTIHAIPVDDVLFVRVDKGTTNAQAIMVLQGRRAPRIGERFRTHCEIPGVTRRYALPIPMRPRQADTDAAAEPRQAREALRALFDLDAMRAKLEHLRVRSERIGDPAVTTAIQEAELATARAVERLRRLT